MRFTDRHFSNEPAHSTPAMCARVVEGPAQTKRLIAALVGLNFITPDEIYRQQYAAVSWRPKW